MPYDPKTPYERILARMHQKWPKRWPEGKKIPERAVAELAGISQPSVHKWKNGGEIDLGNARTVATKLDICMEWLLTGRGDQFPLTSPSPMIQEIIQAAVDLHDTQRMELVKYARYLSSGVTEHRPTTMGKAKTG